MGSATKTCPLNNGLFWRKDDKNRTASYCNRPAWATITMLKSLVTMKLCVPLSRAFFEPVTL